MSLSGNRRWVTRAEAARIAGVHPTLINQWLNKGIIPESATLKVGPVRVRYDASFFQVQRPVVSRA